MHHLGGEVPRLVCVQGDVGADGSKPIYRHPSDYSLSLKPMSDTVKAIRKRVEVMVGHPLNHVLIQLYRSGQDYITEHSDKTLDIRWGSNIVNVSVGAERTMRLRTKRTNVTTGSHTMQDLQRTKQLIPMPDGSIFIMGQKTNAKWLHGIMADKRRDAERSEGERAYDGERISLTFRWIDTFLDKEERLIWGQGAKGNTREERQEVKNGYAAESEGLLQAFGKENQSSEYCWHDIYGAGSNVLHLGFPASTSDLHLGDYKIRV